MDSAVLDVLGLVLLLVGIAMMGVFVRQLYVTGRFSQEYRPARWQMPPGGRRELERSVRATAQDRDRAPAADDLPALQAIASDMAAGRVFLWSMGSVSVMQLGGLVFHRTTPWIFGVAAFCLFMTACAVLIERSARAGATFLRRYPPALAGPEVRR